MALQLSDPSQAALFAIPAASWAALNKRAGMALLGRAIEKEIERTLPGFTALVDASAAWKEQTFPTLVKCANDLAIYATNAAKHFTTLSERLGGQTKPDGTLSSQFAEQAKNLLRGLSAQTQPLTDALTGVSDKVDAFNTANQVVDHQVARYRQTLGPWWQPVAQELTAVDNASGKVRGAWGAVTHDLQSAMSIDITAPFLESLRIDEAIRSWTQINLEAAAFASNAPAQQRYLSGQWFTGPASASSGFIAAATAATPSSESMR